MSFLATTVMSSNRKDITAAACQGRAASEALG